MPDRTFEVTVRRAKSLSASFSNYTHRVTASSESEAEALAIAQSKKANPNDTIFEAKKIVEC